MANPVKVSNDTPRSAINNSISSGAVQGTSSISVFNSSQPNTVIIQVNFTMSIKTFTEQSQNNLLLGFNNDPLTGTSLYSYNIGTSVTGSIWSLSISGPGGSKFTFSKTKIG